MEDLSLPKYSREKLPIRKRQAKVKTDGHDKSSFYEGKREFYLRIPVFILDKQHCSDMVLSQ